MAEAKKELKSALLRHATDLLKLALAVLGSYWSITAHINRTVHDEVRAATLEQVAEVQAGYQGVRLELDTLKMAMGTGAALFNLRIDTIRRQVAAVDRPIFSSTITPPDTAGQQRIVNELRALGQKLDSLAPNLPNIYLGGPRPSR